MSGTRVRPPYSAELFRVQRDQRVLLGSVTGATRTLRSGVDRCVIILPAFPDLKSNMR